ncbi:hypothetical protein [Aliagarivorans taiwanensis]|uniref:hypothetical protein n=1 Tax=Aliagarivorans taiwanensis TaxID=561966 RepID=UPI0012F791B9|nr:hypothetical protein [Aliagarivorans taiwanensis]
MRYLKTPLFSTCDVHCPPDSAPALPSLYFDPLEALLGNPSSNGEQEAMFKQELIEVGEQTLQTAGDYHNAYNACLNHQLELVQLSIRCYLASLLEQPSASVSVEQIAGLGIQPALLSRVMPGWSDEDNVLRPLPVSVLEALDGDEALLFEQSEQVRAKLVHLFEKSQQAEPSFMVTPQVVAVLDLHSPAHQDYARAKSSYVGCAEQAQQFIARHRAIGFRTEGMTGSAIPLSELTRCTTEKGQWHIRGQVRKSTELRYSTQSLFAYRVTQPINILTISAPLAQQRWFITEDVQDKLAALTYSLTDAFFSELAELDSQFGGYTLFSEPFTTLGKNVLRAATTKGGGSFSVSAAIVEGLDDLVREVGYSLDNEEMQAHPDVDPIMTEQTLLQSQLTTVTNKRSALQTSVDYAKQLAQQLGAEPATQPNFPAMTGQQFLAWLSDKRESPLDADLQQLPAQVREALVKLDIHAVEVEGHERPGRASSLLFVVPDTLPSPESCDKAADHRLTSDRNVALWERCPGVFNSQQGECLIAVFGVIDWLEQNAS